MSLIFCLFNSFSFYGTTARGGGDVFVVCVFVCVYVFVRRTLFVCDLLRGGLLHSYDVQVERRGLRTDIYDSSERVEEISYKRRSARGRRPNTAKPNYGDEDDGAQVVRVCVCVCVRGTLNIYIYILSVIAMYVCLVYSLNACAFSIRTYIYINNEKTFRSFYVPLGFRLQSFEVSRCVVF